MKKLLLILILTLIVITTVKADLGVSLTNINPSPVTPGNEFTITFTISNLENKAVNATFELNDKSPFEVQGGKISIQLDPSESKQISFRVFTDSSATSGDKTIRLDYEVDNDNFDETFNIKVLAIETNLIIDSIRSSPELIAPGQDSIVKITIKNLASYELKDISVKLDLLDPLLPFAPKNSVTEQKILSLAPGQSKEISFRITTLASAESKIYKIPVRISYFDEFSRVYNKTDLLGLTVGEIPDIAVTIDKNNLIIGMPTTLIIKTVNKGLTNVKFLNLEIRQSNEYEILSSDNFYIGNLDSDDFETIELKLIPNTNNLKIPVTLRYKDSNNNDYNNNFNLNVRAYSKDEAKQIGLISSNNFLTIIGVIVLLVIVILVFRRLLKRRKQQV